MARKILLADDSVTAQNMGRKILADAGYEVITVNNGSAALKKIAEIKPDLIVLDVYMPGYSGLEVCQRIKEVGDTARIPVLLTVGKLEPFKPEEAKRVRADDYIVKPFEASELLSALSKLEDKVVPRGESSKPGRFARASAALEEGRYDKSMAIEEDDSGWKSRISFPPKKKEKPKEQEVDTAEIYNPVNKDLRTTVEHKEPEPASVSATPEDDKHFNLGALTSEGLPKDVTPEEIAALAAAAAQIQGKVRDEKPAALNTPDVAAPVETAKSETVEIASPAPVEPPKVESKEEAQPVPVPEAAVEAPPATLAAQEAPEKAEEKKPERKSGPAEVMAAIAGLETEWVSVPFAGSADASSAQSSAKQEEPATMAVAAGAESSVTVSRWSAVAVELAPEEASVSLEQEMEKACAPVAAAEQGQAEPVPATLETTSTVPETIAPQPVAEVPALEPAVTEAPAIPSEDTAEATQSAPPVPEAAPETISASVKEMEVVAAKSEQDSAASTEPAAETDGSLQAEAPESPIAEPQPEPKLEEQPQVEQTPAEPVEAKAEAAEEVTEEKVQELSEQPAPAATQEEAPVVEATAPEIPPQEVSEQKEESVPPAEPAEAVAKLEVPEEISEQEPSSEAVSTEPVPVSSASTTGGIDEMAKRESETAAAWASWRKIRETGNGKQAPAAEAPAKEAEETIPEDRAAMAVAVGAESKPEEVNSGLDSDPEIANIVDSVLADMRPKIVEEIARKLGKKK